MDKIGVMCIRQDQPTIDRERHSELFRLVGGWSDKIGESTDIDTEGGAPKRVTGLSSQVSTGVHSPT